MRVLFTNTPCYGKGFHLVRAGCRWPFFFNYDKPPENERVGYRTYPFFLAYAAAYVAHCGKVGDVLQYDAIALNHTYDTFYREIEKIRPDITVMETSTPSIKTDLMVAERVKAMGSEVALSGPHATVYAEELIKLPYVDYVLQGEYEVGAYEMCLMRKKGIYKCKPLQNISALFPYRDNSVYCYSDGFGQDKYIHWPQLQVMTSRGCPYKCNFCLWNSTMTKTYRTRRIGDITREITQCMRVFQFNSVLFDDDTVNVGDKRTIELSEAMGNIDIQWHAMVRADSCSWKAFESMIENGCVGLKVGVETFSQNGLDYLNKGYKSEELIKNIDFLISIGFKVFMSLMDNVPCETISDRKFTADLVQGFVEKGASIQHPNCTPLPGTDLFNSNGKKMSEDWFEYGKFHGEVIKGEKL